MRVTKAVGVSDMKYYVVCLTGEERDFVLDLMKSRIFDLEDDKDNERVVEQKALLNAEKKFELPSRSYNQAERFVS